MSNFKGYYIKIGNCKFDNPAIQREGFHLLPRIEQVTDSGAVASGKLIIKVLPHKPAKMEVTFPIMTEEQYRNYYNVISSSMYLQVEYYDESLDKYKTAICYHTDIGYTPVKYMGKEMILMDKISFIEH